MKREEVLYKIAEEQNKVIENLKNSVNRYKSASDLDEDDTSDPDDYARQTEAKDMQLRFEQILKVAKQNLAFIDAEISKNYSEIEEGALVETNKNWFFLGVNLPHFQLNEKEVFCITKEAPVYKNLLNKKQGSQLEVGNTSFEIVQIM